MLAPPDPLLADGILPGEWTDLVVGGSNLVLAAVALFGHRVRAWLNAPKLALTINERPHEVLATGAPVYTTASLETLHRARASIVCEPR